MMPVSEHCPCRACGKERPDDAGRRGWRRGLCRSCYEKAQGYPLPHWKQWKSTDRVRRYRSDPIKRDRDRAASRAWKAANRERNRARDRAAYWRAKEAQSAG